MSCDKAKPRNEKDDKAKRDEFIAENLNLVHSLSHRYVNKGIEYDDIFSAGCVGLVKAYDNFNVSLGFSFSTYAVPVILGEIRRLFRDGGSVKVSRSIKDLSMKISAEQLRFENEYMRVPTVSELAKLLNATPEEIAMAQNSHLPAISLTVSDSDSAESGGKIADIPSENNEDAIVQKIALSQAMSGLDENDRKIICLRYFEDMTQSEVARKMSMTQVSVSRREKLILKQLRLALCK